MITTYIKAPPEAVWRALTESDFTTRYYYRSTVESDWQAGSPYRYAIDGETAIEGEILEADPPRRLVMTFSAVWDPALAADAPTRLSWELDAAGPGVTRLTVVHGGFDGETETYRQVTGGWSWILAGLKSLLETGEALPPARLSGVRIRLAWIAGRSKPRVLTPAGTLGVPRVDESGHVERRACQMTPLRSGWNAQRSTGRARGAGAEPGAPLLRRFGLGRDRGRRSRAPAPRHPPQPVARRRAGSSARRRS